MATSFLFERWPEGRRISNEATPVFSSGSVTGPTGFDVFTQMFNKKYETEEEAAYREAVFNDNWIAIQEHNKLFDSGLQSFKMGVNINSDFAFNEIIENRSDSKIQDRCKHTNYTKYVSTATQPDSMNYVDQGAVNPIREQGLCNSCWAFSTVATIESHIKLKYEKLVQLSPQYLIDCDSSGENKGCSIGFADLAIEYIQYNGIANKITYPYAAGEGKCNIVAPKSPYNVMGIEQVPFGSDSDLLNALGNAGPITAKIYASPNFTKYKSGVFNDPLCTDDVSVNHAVTIVGYGFDTETKKDFWLLRNSYGTSWGEQGYMKLDRSVANNCQISTCAFIPKV